MALSAVCASAYVTNILNLQRSLGAKSSPELTATKILRAQCHRMGMNSTKSKNEEEIRYFL